MSDLNQLADDLDREAATYASGFYATFDEGERAHLKRAYIASAQRLRAMPTIAGDDRVRERVARALALQDLRERNQATEFPADDARTELLVKMTWRDWLDSADAAIEALTATPRPASLQKRDEGVKSAIHLLEMLRWGQVWPHGAGALFDTLLERLGVEPASSEGAE